MSSSFKNLLTLASVAGLLSSTEAVEAPKGAEVLTVGIVGGR